MIYYKYIPESFEFVEVVEVKVVEVVEVVEVLEVVEVVEVGAESGNPSLQEVCSSRTGWSGRFRLLEN